MVNHPNTCNVMIEEGIHFQMAGEGSQNKVTLL